MGNTRKKSLILALCVILALVLGTVNMSSRIFAIEPLSTSLTWRPALLAPISPASFTLGETQTDASSGGGNVNLLSQRFNEDEFSSEIVGEVENNGTEAVKFVKVATTFYDGNGNIVGTENTYADPSDLSPGMKAPFKIFLTSDSVISDTETYGFTISWDNPDGSTGVTTVSGQAAGQSGDGGDGGGTDGSEQENEEADVGDNDDDSEQNGEE
jgi:hypothetical protein